MSPANALLLVSPTCSYCKGMRKALTTLADTGALSSVTVVDITEQPEMAEQLGVRSVPWLRLGEFVFEGAHTPGELEKWIETFGQPNGWSVYLAHLLATGQLALAERLLRNDPGRLAALMDLAGNPDTEMNIRIGIAAILEGLQGSSTARQLIPLLSGLAQSRHATIRADACHYLVLTGSGEAIPVLQRYTDDDDPVVREIAVDGVAELQGISGA